MAGYHPAGRRAIRIDMLERLADMLRVLDSRKGFEANPDMLSITGMTLDQFADLMTGLGYKAAKAERAKSAKAPSSSDAGAQPVENLADGTPDAADPALAASPENPDTPKPDAEAEDQAAAKTEAEPEVEIYYTFTWGGFARVKPAEGNRKPPQRKSGKPKPRGKAPHGGEKSKSYSARPAKKDKIDPDNPFAAALMGLKDKG